VWHLTTEAVGIDRIDGKSAIFESTREELGTEHSVQSTRELSLTLQRGEQEVQHESRTWKHSRTKQEHGKEPVLKDKKGRSRKKGLSRGTRSTLPRKCQKRVTEKKRT